MPDIREGFKAVLLPAAGVLAIELISDMGGIGAMLHPNPSSALCLLLQLLSMAVFAWVGSNAVKNRGVGVLGGVITAFFAAVLGYGLAFAIDLAYFYTPASYAAKYPPDFIAGWGGSLNLAIAMLAPFLAIGIMAGTFMGAASAIFAAREMKIPIFSRAWLLASREPPPRS